MIKHPIGIFISGRGSNLKSIVDACKEQEYPAEIKVVFSNNKNAPGLSFAKENNLEVITLDYHNFKNTEEYEEKIISLLKPYDLKLICLAGYMKIISKKFFLRYGSPPVNNSNLISLKFDEIFSNSSNVRSFLVSFNFSE